MPTESPRDKTIELIFAASRYLAAETERAAARDALFDKLPVLLPAARQAAGRMSQEGLADKIGLHATAISKIENGRQIPNMGNLARMVRVFAEKALGIPGPSTVQYDDALLEAIYLFQGEYPETEPVNGD
jgi:ribosome-binding protein aMBF1 (putative translation factor)